MRGRLSGGAVVLLVLLAAIVIRRMGDDSDDAHEFTGLSMGSRYAVTVDADLDEVERARVAGAIEAKLALVTRLMSTYEPESEVSRFNRHASEEPFPLSAETVKVLVMARDISERSEGAFDVTVGPLVDVWGFGPAPEVKPVPDSAALAEILPLVDYEGLHLDPRNGTAQKADAAIRIDPTAIAQGYAAELVADTLRALGLAAFLVDVGGELRAEGTRDDDSGWRVGIERPDGGSGLAGTIDLIDEGIDTSGDYRNYFEEDGVAYAHLIDPRTGQAVRMRRASVTVVHDDTAIADAWATALMVLGPDEGFEIAVREGLAALFLSAADGELVWEATPEMAGRFVPAR
jgi:thiamine biosynthesis lipoprotein